MRTPTRTSGVLAFLLVALILAGCGGEKAPEASFELLAGIPAVPRSRPMASAAGTDAVQAGYLAGLPADTVAAWYRRWFLKEGWHITGDVRAGNGDVTLHAEKDGRPLWLIIQPSSDGLTSRYSVIGAGKDSSRTQNPGPGR